MTTDRDEPMDSDGLKRLTRWQLGHTQPKRYSFDLDHPVQDDLAWAADTIAALRQTVERLQAELGSDAAEYRCACVFVDGEIQEHCKYHGDLLAQVERLEQANVVPGMMRCAKCDFVLTRTNLYVNQGTTGPGDNKTEPCPNGCGPLWPLTWKEYADSTDKAVMRFIDERDALRSQVDALRPFDARLRAAERAFEKLHDDVSDNQDQSSCASVVLPTLVLIRDLRAALQGADEGGSQHDHP